MASQIIHSDQSSTHVPYIDFTQGLLKPEKACQVMPPVPKDAPASASPPLQCSSLALSTQPHFFSLSIHRRRRSDGSKEIWVIPSYIHQEFTEVQQFSDCSCFTNGHSHNLTHPDTFWFASPGNLYSKESKVLFQPWAYLL